jgi:hypothetical protein
MKRLIVALAMGVTVTPVAALDVVGRAGVTYVRSDLYDPSSVHTTEPRLDLDLALDAHGFFRRSDLVDWRLGASYRRLSQELNGTRTSLQSSILYNGRISLFSARTSPVSLTLDANRVQSEFSTNPSLNVTGETITQVAGGQVAVRFADRPALTAGYHRIGVETSIPGVGRNERTTDRITGSLHTGTPVFDVSADYTGDLNDGTWVSDRSDVHTAGVGARVPIGSSFEIVASDIYQAVLPHQLVLGAYRQETNGFRLYGRNRGQFGDRQVVTYSYVHALSQTFASPLREEVRQALRYEGDLLLTDPNLFTRWILDGSVTQARNGGTELDTTGETAGVQLWWRRPSATSTYEVFGGPYFGFIQSDVLGDDQGWGLTATGRARFPWRDQNLNLSYTADYADSLYGSPGWTIRQSVGAAVGGPFGGWIHSTSLSASAFRTGGGFFGDGAGRTVDLFLHGERRDLIVELRGTLQDGVTGATPGDIAGDGLFIPAPFDTKSRQLLLRGTSILYPGLSATAHGRYLSSVYPGQPTLHQYEVLGSIQYAYGALTFALEDRVTRYERASGWSTVNQVMLRVYRTIGWRSF